MRVALLLLFSLTISGMHAQDTLRSMSLTVFLQHVREHHPVAQVATNSVEQANAVITLSKGAFDPKLFAGIDQKYFEGKTYYSTISSGLKIPTRAGIDFKVMADWNKGQYLNDQSRVPEDGLTYLGVEIPIGKGLFTDERRTQLKRAEVAYRQSAVERQLTLNNLLYEAGQDFIYWQEQEAQADLAREGLELAELRLQQIRASAQLGDRPAIDTVEATAQYFNRLVDWQQRVLQAKNARLSVEKYLWEQGMIPLTLEENIRPDALQPVSPSLVATDSLTFHPWLTWYDLKIKDLNLERRYKIEQLKPELTFNYNFLQTPQDLVSANFSFTNYKWGATFNFPILLRKERSSLEITRLKINSAQYDYALKQREITIKIAQVNNEWVTRYEQSEAASMVSRNYKTLAQAERSLFNAGESSLFLVNAREASYLSAQSKYFESVAKTQKSALEAKYALGKLGE